LLFRLPAATATAAFVAVAVAVMVSVTIALSAAVAAAAALHLGLFKLASANFFVKALILNLRRMEAFEFPFFLVAETVAFLFPLVVVLFPEGVGALKAVFHVVIAEVVVHIFKAVH